MSRSSSTANADGQSRRRYSSEFKLQAVDLSTDIGYKQAASDLGINESMLRNWAKAVRDKGRMVFSHSSERTDIESENRRLKEENRVLKMERDILKKAATYFAKESK